MHAITYICSIVSQPRSS